MQLPASAVSPTKPSPATDKGYTSLPSGRLVLGHYFFETLPRLAATEDPLGESQPSAAGGPGCRARACPVRSVTRLRFGIQALLFVLRPPLSPLGGVAAEHREADLSDVITVAIILQVRQVTKGK